jgi:hypothetical protein
MSPQLNSSLKSILQEFPAVGQASGYPNKHYRRDRRIAIRKWSESDSAQRRMTQIKGMIADLERMVNGLGIEIQAEQVRSRVNNPTRFDYPTLATALIKRRDNARRSIDALRQNLIDLDRVAMKKDAFNIA